MGSNSLSGGHKHFCLDLIRETL